MVGLRARSDCAPERHWTFCGIGSFSTSDFSIVSLHFPFVYFGSAFRFADLSFEFCFCLVVGFYFSFVPQLFELFLSLFGLFKSQLCCSDVIVFPQTSWSALQDRQSEHQRTINFDDHVNVSLFTLGLGFCVLISTDLFFAAIGWGSECGEGWNGNGQPSVEECRIQRGVVVAPI